MSYGRVGKVTIYQQPALEESSSFFAEMVQTAVEITDLQIRFKIEKSLGKDPNTCEVIISNLSEDSRTEFEKRPLRVHLSAGYESDGGPRLLFVGDVRKGSGSKLVGTVWETKLLLGDGARAIYGARAKSRSYKRGTPIKDVLREVVASLGLTLPADILAAPALAAGIPTGESVTGWASDELTRLLAPYGYSWSIQNGRMQILLDDQVLPEPYALDQDNGVLGVPELKVPEKTSDKKGPSLEVRHQLYPELSPGNEFELLRSRSAKGKYKIEKIKHDGDTDGPTWETAIEAKPL